MADANKKRLVAIGINGSVSRLTDIGNSYSIIDLIYPIGSIYCSLDPSFDPNKIWTGTTWEKIKEGIFLEATETADSIGTEKEAGLPNITGTIGNWPSVSGRGTGTFKNYYAGNISGYGGAGSYTYYYGDIDASRSNPIYGNSETVQPHSITCFIWKRIEPVIDVTTT